MIVIDGSRGEGGGQVLRTSLALSLITGQPFRIENIRARRAKPGLLHQHLTAVNAAMEIGNAKVEGAAIASGTLTFDPRPVRSGDYSFSIGTAGSTMLVLQTILLPLALADGPSMIELEGGTHNPTSPPFDFMQHAFLPLLARMGAQVELELIRPGFYPAGGGKVRALISPAGKLGALHIETRGALVTRRAKAIVANLPQSIAEREAQTAIKVLDWPQTSAEAHTLEGSAGPGNLISIIAGHEHATDVFTAVGERGKRAEQVALEAAREAKRYLDSEAAIGEHLADQLLLPLSVGAGGSFTTTPLSGHSATNMDTIRLFVNATFTCEEVNERLTRVTVQGT
jgi:RNA 3'-terminal phosphate cyclase (ATP)